MNEFGPAESRSPRDPETEYAVSSVARPALQAEQILVWWRGHWQIGKRLRLVRDTAWLQAVLVSLPR